MLGAWGKVITFEVGNQKLLTPEDIRISGATPRYAQHDIVGAKPRREFVGPGLASCSLRVVISALRGVPPRALLDGLRAARDAGTAYALVIGGKNVFPSGSLATLDGIEEEWNFFTGAGGLLQATGSLTFGEYIAPKSSTVAAAGTVSKANVTRVRA